jgi:putative endonuclease
MGKTSYVYILASERNGTLYIGVTSNLVKRVWQHREGVADGFSKRYGVKRLVYFEVFEDMPEAIGREKAMKKWRRNWKIDAIEKDNPTWHDLFDEITA